MADVSADVAPAAIGANSGAPNAVAPAAAIAGADLTSIFETGFAIVLIPFHANVPTGFITLLYAHFPAFAIPLPAGFITLFHTVLPNFFSILPKPIL